MRFYCVNIFIYFVPWFLSCSIVHISYSKLSCQVGNPMLKFAILCETVDLKTVLRVIN